MKSETQDIDFRVSHDHKTVLESRESNSISQFQCILRLSKTSVQIMVSQINCINELNILYTLDTAN